jgi:hypothetical protein
MDKTKGYATIYESALQLPAVCDHASRLLHD